MNGYFFRGSTTIFFFSYFASLFTGDQLLMESISKFFPKFAPWGANSFL